MLEYLSDIFHMTPLFFRAKGGLESRVAGLASVLSEALRIKEDVHLSGFQWDRARSRASAMHPGSICVTSALCCCPQGSQREG